MDKGICAAALISRGSGGPTPPALAPVLFQPVLGWMAAQLISAGVSELFAVCREEDRARAQACLPEGVRLRYSGETGAESRRGMLVFARPAIVSAGAVREAAKRLDAQNASAGCVLDADGNRTGVYAIKNAEPDWVLSRLEDEAGFEAALEREGISVCGIALAQGVVRLDSPSALQTAQQALRTAVVAEHMEKGVYFADPATALIGPGVTIGAGTVVLPGVILRGKTAVGQNCEIGPNAVLDNASVGDNSTVNASQVLNSRVGSGVKIGPFAYIRPDCEVSDNVKIGDFVELKNARVGEGTKIPHLIYVGDADIGSKTNIGCGSITVNYDGCKKHRTKVGDRAFIGCNTNLVAPVTVGDDAYTAAGSTITGDVPPGALAIGRARQVNKVGWVEIKRRRDAMK